MPDRHPQSQEGTVPEGSWSVWRCGNCGGVRQAVGEGRCAELAACRAAELEQVDVVPADRLKEVERQRDDAELKAEALEEDANGERDRAEKAEAAEAALVERDQQVREAIKELQEIARGFDAYENDRPFGLDTNEAREFEVDDDFASFFAARAAAAHLALTQPSSTPLQRDPEVGEDGAKSSGVEEYSDDELREIGRLFLERAPTDRPEILKQIGVHVADVDDKTGLWLDGLRDARDRGLIPQLAEAVGFKRLQPEADPEVPRCGGSGVLYASGSGNPYDEDPVVERNCPACPDCVKGPHRITLVAQAMFAPLEAEGFMPSGSQCQEAERVIALVERTRPTPPVPDCQSTPELLGEEAAEAIRELDEIAMAAWRAREALHLNLAELGKGLDPATTKNLADLVNDLNEHMPLGEDGHVWRMRKVVRRALEDCERGEGHARGEDAEAERPAGATGPERIPCQGSSASPSGAQEGTGIGGADPNQPVQPEPSRLPDSTPEANTPLASTQPESPGNSGEAADDRLYLLLALFDRRDGSPLADLVQTAREGFERCHPDMGADENRHAWDQFDSLWNSYTQQERLALAKPLFTQPVPGNSGGVEEGLLRRLRNDDDLTHLALWVFNRMRAISPAVSDWTAMSAAMDHMAAALEADENPVDILARLMSEAAVSTQPPSPQACER